MKLHDIVRKKSNICDMNESRKELFLLIKEIKTFFDGLEFLETPTPPMVQNPGMEPHIHPFKIKHTYSNEDTDFYLHTSPEFYMKELLSEGFEKIYNLSYCFRDEPSSQTHRPQFMMLEWYRAHSRYESIMDDVTNLIKNCQTKLDTRPLKNFPRLTVNEAFQNELSFPILDFLDKKELYSKIKSDFKDIHLASINELSWDDLFFLLFLNKIEPQLEKEDFVLLYEYPAPLAALSTIKTNDQRVCERFEVYLRGVELCNCFNELTNLEEQKKRMREDGKIKKELYGYELPEPKVLFDALDRGIPPSAGVALGVERLLLGLTEVNNPFFN